MTFFKMAGFLTNRRFNSFQRLQARFFLELLARIQTDATVGEQPRHRLHRTSHEFIVDVIIIEDATRHLGI